MSSDIHPIAVVLARTLLTVVALIGLTLGLGLYFSGVVVPIWQWMLIVSAVILSLLSACFESSTGVVATVVTFLYPFH